MYTTIAECFNIACIYREEGHQLMNSMCPCEPWCMANMAKDFLEHLKKCRSERSRTGDEIFMQDFMSFKPKNLKEESVEHCARGWKAPQQVLLQQ